MKPSWPRAMRSLTARLSLLLATVFVATLAGIGSFLYVFLDGEIEERARAELEGKTELVRHLVGQMGSAGRLAATENRLRDALIGHPRTHVILLAADGAVLFRSSRSALDDNLMDHVRARIAAGETGPYAAHDAMPFRASAERIRLSDPSRSELWLLVAVETGEDERFLRTYLRSLLLTLIIGSVLAALAGLWAIRAGLAPISRIARVAEQVSARRLEDRVLIEDTPPELAPLVASFNAMLERLADSFRRLSEFSSDLAHELRTPIHSVLGHAQLALSRERSAAEYRSALETIVDDTDRLGGTVRDLLFLAQAENASATLLREAVDLRVELETVVSFFQVLAEEKNVTVIREGAATVDADRNMVQRALSNLLSNALRHTPAGGTMVARVVRAPEGETCIEVTNPGPGFAPQSPERIFDRFYRTGGSRADATGGAGLGLAIVRSIMTLHKGRVEVESTPQGPTLFRLRFPASAAGSIISYATESPAI